mgnify:CR=1 FL=1
MGKTTIKISNAGKPAPRWFRKFKKVTGILTVVANAMIASWPSADEMLKMKIQLWCTIGIGGILEALEVLLANGEEYKNSDGK